jgi:hypothetical protein
MADREIIFEIRVSGGFAQVNAIDVATGLEVSVTTPASAARADQHRLARRKLEGQLANNALTNVTAKPASHGQHSDAPARASPSPKRGIIA